MDMQTTNEMRVSLSKAIEEWWNTKGCSSGETPWTGDNIFSIMADAAILVLEGISDTERYLRDQEYLKDE